MCYLVPVHILNSESLFCIFMKSFVYEGDKLYFLYVKAKWDVSFFFSFTSNLEFRKIRDF